MGETENEVWKPKSRNSFNYFLKLLFRDNSEWHCFKFSGYWVGMVTGKPFFRAKEYTAFAKHTFFFDIVISNV